MTFINRAWRLCPPLWIGLADMAWAISALNPAPASNAADSVGKINSVVWIFLHLPAAYLGSLPFESSAVIGAQFPAGQLLLIGALGVLQTAAFVWVVGTFIVWKTQTKAIFPGNGAVFGDHEELKAFGGKCVQAERDGQSLRYYWFEAENPKAVLVMYHGNAQGAFERLDFARALQPEGVSVALVEYPGYGGDKGQTGEWPILRNGLAAYDEIDSQRGSLPLFAMGESLGTGVATYVASLRKPRAILLSTPYTSMASVAKYRYPWMPIHQLIHHPIKAMLWAPHVQCPVLILHGTLDKTVPYFLGLAEGRRLKRLERFVTIEGAGHSNIREMNQGQFWKDCKEFISSHLQAA